MTDDEVRVGKKLARVFLIPSVHGGGPPPLRISMHITVTEEEYIGLGRPTIGDKYGVLLGKEVVMQRAMNVTFGDESIDAIIAELTPGEKQAMLDAAMTAFDKVDIMQVPVLGPVTKELWMQQLMKDDEMSREVAATTIRLAEKENRVAQPEPGIYAKVPEAKA